jgi:hypothetical protein
VVYIDDVPVLLFNGMTVRHVLIAAGLWPEKERLRISDEWGSEIGPDGAVYDRMRILTSLRYVKKEGVQSE